MTTVYRIVFAAILAVITTTGLQALGITAEFSFITLIVLFINLGIAALVSPALENVGSFSSPREQGKVKWFNVSKGYGFITRENGEDIFVHFRSIRGRGRRSLSESQQVEYIVTQGEKGPQAEDVRPVGK